MSIIAHYHQHGKPPIPCTIHKTREDGTVDLANANGFIIVTECQVSTDGADGTCTLATPEKKARKPRKTTKPGNGTDTDEDAILDDDQLADAKASLADAEKVLASNPDNTQLAADVEKLKAAIAAYEADEDEAK